MSGITPNEIREIEETCARERLEAAAPDLYAALEMLLPDAEEYMRRTASGSPAAIEMARAALRKARGESPDAAK